MELKKTLAEILEISDAELLLWWQYYNEMPFGYYRHEAREAFNCQIITAPHITTKIELGKFMLFKAPEKELTDEQLSAKLIKIFGRK